MLGSFPGTLRMGAGNCSPSVRYVAPRFARSGLEAIYMNPLAGYMNPLAGSGTIDAGGTVSEGGAAVEGSINVGSSVGESL